MLSKVIRKASFGMVLLGLASWAGGVHSAENVGVDDQSLIIEDVRCEGNKEFDCDFIRLKFYQNVGDFADSKQISDAERRLNNVPQFYIAQSRTEKGSADNKVVVIFSVTEIPKVNYRLGVSISANKFNGESRFGSSESSARTIGGSATVENTNIFNSGKLLSFTVGGAASRSDRRYNVRFVRPDESFNFRQRTEAEDESVNYALNYFDPHLLGSERYYMRLSAQHSEYSSEITSNTITGNAPFFFFPTSKYSDSNTRYGATFGRNTGRFSYVDVNYLRVDENYQQFSLGYGFSREDNRIFATKGDRLDFRVARDDYQDSLNFRYSKNLALSDHQVFELGAGAAYSVFRDIDDYDDGSTTYFVDAQYRHASELALTNGRYSGWYVGTRISGVDSEANLAEESISLRSGYSKIFKGIDLDIGLSYTIDKDLF